MFNSNDFKTYRAHLGFSSQQNFKAFLSAKDISPAIDFSYITLLNQRLADIFTRLNSIYYKPCSIDEFLQTHLFGVFETIKDNAILHKLTNQGRRKEEVYFSWMRGYLVCEYFKAAIADIFDTPPKHIHNIGEDIYTSAESFRRTPRADLQIGDLRLEVQSGFQGVNDIKEHKVREAKALFKSEGVKTLVLHVDLFNGQGALIDISDIPDDDLNWITRQQMEGQSVLNIEQNHFKWLLSNPPTALKEEITNQK